MKLETSRNVTKSKRSLHWCRSISKKYLCTFYYSINQKVITLSGRRFITVSGGFITLSGSYYSIGRFYYIIGQLLQYRAFITLSVGTVGIALVQLATVLVVSGGAIPVSRYMLVMFAGLKQPVIIRLPVCDYWPE